LTQPREDRLFPTFIGQKLWPAPASACLDPRTPDATLVMENWFLAPHIMWAILAGGTAIVKG